MSRLQYAALAGLSLVFAAPAVALEPVKSPPPVQMHVPGFTVRQLPVELSNVNNVLYREDGVLMALAYDGNIYLLRDTDGDALEDDAKLFWKNEGQLRAPVGIALTPPGYAHGRGVIVPSKAKCSLIVDTDGDDVADKEQVIAEGWPELPVRIDSLGVAVDPQDHAIYFGVGTTDFSNGHLVDENGVGHYDLKGEHGTILRIAPDLKSREIFATGIRFPVGIRFNKDGELFCTDQEGATWLPNGNPFDELLHVQRGRHYGFPPRHPRHLPDVIDEPSVFDFRPQHQSTCGLNFNEPLADGSIFGPGWWRSDALITGFSRGKLYRTKLVRTESGYVAQNQLIGTANMMPSDACLAPGGSLVVAVHSGGPDWGTGPAGEGKLFKVTYDKAGPAIPSLAWAHSPREVRIAFDRPIDPALLKELAARATIEGGEFVAAADRFESFRPGYAVVKHQRKTPRRKVDVQGVQLTADRRTLILTTEPQTTAMNYSIALPGIAPTAGSEVSGDVLPQLPDVDLQYDLSGVEVVWEGDDGQSWRGWLPTLDTQVAHELTQTSAEHGEFWRQVRGAGTLTLRTAVDLKDMLHPVLQPGTTIDYEPAKEKVTLSVKADGPITVHLDGKAGQALINAGGRDSFQTVTGDEQSRLLEVVVRKTAGANIPSVSVHYSTNENSRPRALQLRRMMLPWAQRDDKPAEMIDNRELPELKEGDWLRGEKEFYGSEAACSKCHMMRGVGGEIGPDLSNLPQRDYASVLRDVTQPSFAINPDFVSQTVLLKEGRVLAGTVRTEDERVIVADQEGKETVIPLDEVEAMEHSPQSIMPEGIPKALGEERLRDLMTFLLVAPPTMPVYGAMAPPLPRRMEEVEAVLAGSVAADSSAIPARRLHVVLVAGAKDHGPGEHDYPAWKKAWKDLLELTDNVRVTTAEEWPSADDLKSADALVVYQKGDWTPERARDVDAFLARGGGISYIHYAVSGRANAEGFAERIGLAWNEAWPKYRHGPLDVEFVPGSKHPIARNFDKIHFYDESYWNSVGDPKRISLLATGVEEGQPQPLFWTREHGGGRIFVSVPGHYSWTFDDPLFRVLLLRGLAWTVDEPVDRFNELVLPGARVRAIAK
ncbi:MAG: ThuA domain-containing protein [Pirellulales bacterium]|nr:ThuA domain-containing protein [Pirellulales bacterium]